MILAKRLLATFHALLLAWTASLPATPVHLLDSIEANTTPDQWNAAGLHKLTSSEKDALEQLLLSKADSYPALIPAQPCADKVKWVYEAKPFHGTYEKIPPVEEYDESTMPYSLAICTIFQHESDWLKEWIEYHKLVGVEHFYLYNNCSNDDYFSILEPYLLNGEVELIQYPVRNFPVNTQVYAYHDAILRSRGQTRWLAIIDTDEFIVPMPPYNTLPELLTDYEEYGGLGINWLMHGTADVDTVPKGKLMIEVLDKKAPDSYDANTTIKSIVKPHRVLRVNDPHTCTFTNGYFTVDSNKQPVMGMNFTIPLDKVRINHYWARTEHFFWTIKVPRLNNIEWRRLSRKTRQQFLKKLNTEPSTDILRFVPALREKMGLDP